MNFFLCREQSIDNGSKIAMQDASTSIEFQWSRQMTIISQSSFGSGIIEFTEGLSTETTNWLQSEPKRSEPWMTPDILKELETSGKLHKMWKKKTNDQSSLAFRQHWTRVSNMIKAAKRAFESDAEWRVDLNRFDDLEVCYLVGREGSPVVGG